MKNFRYHTRKPWFYAAGWLLTFLLAISLRHSGFFQGPTFEVIFAACLALLGLLVLLPCTLGSREPLAGNAKTLGSCYPLLARVTCCLVLAAVLVGFIAVMLRNETVDSTVRLRVVLGVVGLGIFSLRKPPGQAPNESLSPTDDPGL